MSRLSRAVFVVVIILIIDQIIKFWIKTNMTLGQEFVVFDDWFKIHFTENKGMAFGWEIGGDNGKLILTSFRILAVTGIAWFLTHLAKHKYAFVALLSVSLVLAGALGNIIDSVFYGVLFSASTLASPAEFLPPGGGYESLMYGSVVDMFYFPLINTTYPEWIPYLGGNRLQFFRPVFNLADASITVGVILIIIFRKKFDTQEEPIVSVK